MKSAYEIAMSRLEKNSPTVKLNEKQKQEVAEIDSQYIAKIAERKVFLEDEIKKTLLNNKEEEADHLRRQLAVDISRLEEEREEKKLRVRKN
ncbi:MAG: hypothetical protein ABI443_12105 [Chthoniobacterales bacterium]